MAGNNYPPEIMDDIKFVLANEQKLKEAKDRILAHCKENGDILDEQNNLKVQIVRRTLNSLDKEKMTDYRKDKVIEAISINRANVLDYAKTEDLKKAGYTPETAKDLFITKISESVKITPIPIKERRS